MVFLDFVEEELCEYQLGKRIARTRGASDSSDSREPMLSTRQRGYGEDSGAEIKIGLLCDTDK